MSWHANRRTLFGRFWVNSPRWLRGLTWRRFPASRMRREAIADLVHWQYRRMNELGRIPTEAFSPDVESLQAPELMGTAGVYHGHAGLQDLWRELHDAWGTVAFEPEVIREFGDRDGVIVIARVRNVGLGSGIETDREVAHVYRGLRSGSITHLESIWEPARALEAVGLLDRG
jgi:ketosteroid isomerase-like protein